MEFEVTEDVVDDYRRWGIVVGISELEGVDVGDGALEGEVVEGGKESDGDGDIGRRERVGKLSGR